MPHGMAKQQAEWQAVEQQTASPRGGQPTVHQLGVVGACALALGRAPHLCHAHLQRGRRGGLKSNVR